MSHKHRILFNTFAAVLLFTVSVESAPESEAPEKPAGLRIENGWFVDGDRVVWGYAQHNGWWGGYRTGNGFWTTYKLRTAITRNDPGRVGPCRTEDLDRLTDNMLRCGYPGFEHNFGLWFDRRRDAHDTGRRTDAKVVGPLLEQPWARGEGDAAWDGLPKYDLTRFNPWYFERLKKFADLCDRKGTILFHNFYNQHCLLETDAHYVDFPWRPTNCIQPTGMPDAIPAANAFYDVSDPVRRRLHRAYIRHCLDVLGSNTNVVHLVSEEYTGPREFVAFWIDTIVEWERETGRDVLVGLGATRDVQDAILADPKRSAAVSVIDLRYWWYKADGALFAPPGGKEVPGRYASCFDVAKQSPPGQIYRQVREYRQRYPDKAIIHAIDASREQTWAFLMAGGAILIRRMEYADSPGPRPWDPPADYVAPEDSAIIQPTYDFIRTALAEILPHMQPSDLIRESAAPTWCLADDGDNFLVYAPKGDLFRLDLATARGPFRAQWFDPETGRLSDATDGEISGGTAVEFNSPSSHPLVLWLKKH